MAAITYKAPAKVILSGEHAVVYGKPALICGLGKYMYVTVSDKGETDTQLLAGSKPVIEAVHTYLKKNYPDKQLKIPVISVKNDVPLGRGLGSSAAFAIALSAALLHYHLGEEPAKDTVNSLAYTAEKHFHGTPSGADNTTCCYGGLIYFRKEFEFLKTISALNAKLPEQIESRLLLIDSGKPVEPTSEMVKQVRIFYNEHPNEADEILCKIEKITKRLVVSVIKEDSKGFCEGLQENQKLLQELGVVSKKAEQLLEQLREYGTGKITGAGGNAEGSGYILFYAHDTAKTKTYLNENGIEYIPFIQDFHGVQYQKSL